MRILRSKMWAAVVALAVSTGVAASAQNTGTVHGHVLDPIGQPITNGEVKFTTDMTVDPKEAKFAVTATLDGSGNYTATVPAGHYFAYAFQAGNSVDRMDVVVAAGDNKTLDIDMTRAEYYKDMSPERKKEIEEYKKKYEAVSGANAVIKNLNATLIRVRADLAAAVPPTYGDVSKDVSDMKSATDAKPDESVLWVVFGDALSAQGDHLAHEDKAAGKSVMSDEDVIKLYSDAANAYQKGAELNAASKKPIPGDQAISYNSLGNVEAKMGKVSDASAAFEKAVALDPTKAGMYYNNEAATLFNAQQNDASLAAAEKAIAADPNRPDPYFIKGQILIAKSTFDAKTQKLVAPEGCVDAYQHFLSIAPPNDKKIPQVKEVLASLGEKIDLKYNANKKK